MDSWGEAHWKCSCVGPRVQLGPTWARRYIMDSNLEAVRVGNGQDHSGPTAGSAEPAWQEWAGPPPPRRLTHRPSKPGLDTWPRGHVAIHVEGAPVASTWTHGPISGGLTWQTRDRHVCVARRYMSLTWCLFSWVTGKINQVQRRGLPSPRGRGGPDNCRRGGNLINRPNLGWPRGGPRGRGASGFDLDARTDLRGPDLYGQARIGGTPHFGRAMDCRTEPGPVGSLRGGMAT